MGLSPAPGSDFADRCRPWTGSCRLAGLQAPVEILFDAYAVPHVYARDPDDAWMAVGYLHGRERLWQMELYRRATGGRLSEVLGPSTLRVDKRFVGLGLRRAAEEEWRTASPTVRSALERYSQGVNAAVGTMGRWQRPPEFLALGIEPEPWTPVDSLSVGRLMAWRLAENRWGELVRGRLTSAIGAAEANRLMATWPSSAPSIVDRAASDTVVPPRPAGGEPGSAAGRPDGLAGTRSRCRQASNGWTSRPARAEATAG